MSKIWLFLKVLCICKPKIENSVFSRKLGHFFHICLFPFFISFNFDRKNSIWAIFCLKSIFNGQRPPFRPKWTSPENFMASAFVVLEPLITKNLNPCCIVYIGGFFSENGENGENGLNCWKTDFFSKFYVFGVQKLKIQYFFENWVIFSIFWTQNT